jgi:glucokinase
MTLLGIEIGGTKLQLGLGAGDGIITRLIRRPVDPSKEAEGIRAQIVEAFRSLDAPISAVGIGFGGPVDVDRGVVTKSHQVEGWDGFALADWARSELGIPLVTVSNDADSAALGEALFGAGRGMSPILYVNSGSGIGGGLVIDEKIYRGSGVGSIEIGHIIVEHYEPRTLEQIASGWSIAEAGRAWARRETEDGWESGGLLRIAGGDPNQVTTATVVRAIREQPDGVAVNVLNRATTAMGRALAHAVTLLAPRRVILGGGVSLIDDDLWLDPIRLALDECVFPPFRGTFDVVTAELGEDVVVHGALALARQALDQ